MTTPTHQAPQLPDHPEPHILAWTALELRAIEAYGLAMFEAGRQEAEALRAENEALRTAAREFYNLTIAHDRKVRITSKVKAHTEEVWDAARRLFDVLASGASPKRYSLDADTQGIRALTADAIMGALAFGAQGVNPPPDGHWLISFWQMARAERSLVASEIEALRADAGVRAAVHRWHERSVALGADGVEDVIRAAEIAKRRSQLHSIDGFVAEWKFPTASEEALRSALECMLTFFGMDEEEHSKQVFDQARTALDAARKSAPVAGNGEQHAER